jgi:hypothetical protein
MDSWKRFFNEPGTLFAIFSSGLVGLMVGIANGVIQRKHGGWGGFFGAMLIGVAVAVIIGLGVQDWIKSEAFRLAIVGVCAVISDDIWQGLKTFGIGLRTDPLGSIARLIDAMRGRSATSHSPAPTPVPYPKPPIAADDTPPMRSYQEE